jgi:GDP-4-dehydro-6-deoxy-D-mannose reductase
MPSFARQIAALERAGSPGVLRVGNLAVTRDILDVRDVAECYARLLESGERGEAYNVCSGSGMPLTRVISRLIEMARVPVRIEVDPGRVRPADVPYLVGDPSRVTTETGWRPRFKLDDTLLDLLNHCRADLE